ncbi:MAG: 30S ribosomal protein S13 [Patescibacteria group bacterium]|nr:30S ribosomal protein S13 [Patescibacteria group bacterium]
MVRIAGINLPDNKRVEVALTYIYGIGRSTSVKILDELKINKDTKSKDLSDKEADALRVRIEKMPIEGDLRRAFSQDIKRLKDIGTYRGIRHKASLPVRGQRTKTNARTKRGKRVTMGSGRKKDQKT